MSNNLSKLWVDDLRPPPDDTWRWVTTSSEAIQWLQDACIGTISLDHDLGGDDTTRPIVLHMCMEEIWPKIIYIHSCNVVGIDWLAKMCVRYSPDTTVVEIRGEWR